MPPIRFNSREESIGVSVKLTSMETTTANAIVQATTHFDDPKILADVSKGLGAPMRGIAMEQLPESERLAVRGW